jgi:hypothetical protein
MLLVASFQTMGKEEAQKLTGSQYDISLLS